MKNWRTTDQKMNETFATNLRKAMEEADVTQKELAAEVGIDPTILSKYMNARIYPGGQILVRLAVALDTTVEKLAL